MKPGTYRIVNLASGTAITWIGSGGVASRPVDSGGVSQHWYAQHSGDGYRFRNVRSGGYLTVASTDDNNCELYSSGYPTSWMLLPNPEHRGHNIFGIVMGDTDRILDLADEPDRPDKTKVYAFSYYHYRGPSKHRVWRFEHKNDETGEESPDLGGQTQGVDPRAEETITSQASEISFLRQLILNGQQKKAEDNPDVSHLKEEVARLTSQVDRLELLLAEARDLPRPPNNMT